MSDIVERLREGRTAGSHLRWTVTDIHLEAADTIESLRAELTVLQENTRWWPGNVDGTHMCEGCGTILHHGGHCDCSWNRSIVPVREEE